MKKIDTLSTEELMKEFDLTKEEVESIESIDEEFLNNAPGVVKIDGKFYLEEEE